MDRHHRSHHRPSQQGFSMVEVLMAAFIMAIGLLGLAALQVTSQAFGTGSRYRGTATFIAHSVLDQIQAEGSTTAAQRFSFGVVTLPPAGFTYIGNADATASAANIPGPSFTILGLLPTDPYYTANPTASTNIVFKTTWQRSAGNIIYQTGSATASVAAIQQFLVNVYWDEYDPVKKTTTQKYITVSRYVRI
ncbi:MAG TPA: prepilin-type N-terminal cleavage/methylation domain-containing protein [Holophagaceae bacterium]|nr:prepilin-type N-terminal cleavage/methylation domain-containing protein [Holophagaceae bacterium]